MFNHHPSQMTPINALTLSLTSQPQSPSVPFLLSSIPIIYVGAVAYFPPPPPFFASLPPLPPSLPAVLTSVKRQPCVQPSDRKTCSALTHAEPEHILPPSAARMQRGVKQMSVWEFLNVFNELYVQKAPTFSS